ncbi:hypothetical protein BJ508DRAFT_329026 [Ascobolus immersus RN42]|uniref:Uncharacterized protein n=1 Tax=Ascobolus immersus RN42 TaxID=1160509 RepID=A0A3N4HZT6_ASCIM|nr:hypothetical protein BJ508DRAFT_329026 [Ascobolus immersus RN42]
MRFTILLPLLLSLAIKSTLASTLGISKLDSIICPSSASSRPAPPLKDCYAAVDKVRRALEKEAIPFYTYLCYDAKSYENIYRVVSSGKCLIVVNFAGSQGGITDVHNCFLASEFLSLAGQTLSECGKREEKNVRAVFKWGRQIFFEFVYDEREMGVFDEVRVAEACDQCIPMEDNRLGVGRL